MRGVLLVVEFTAISNTAAESVARVLDGFLGATPAPGGLLSYWVVRHGEHTTRVLVVEEWTDAALQQASIARPEFAAVMHELAPLLAAQPNGDSYDVVTAGPVRST